MRFALFWDSTLRKPPEERKSRAKSFVKLLCTFLWSYQGNIRTASILSRRTPMFPKLTMYLLKAQKFLHLLTHKEHFNSKLLLCIIWKRMAPRLIHEGTTNLSTTRIFTKNFTHLFPLTPVHLLICLLHAGGTLRSHRTGWHTADDSLNVFGYNL
jgi:hypothetical protein